MKKNKRKNQENVETVAKSFYGFFHRISSVIVCCYMLLILVVLPLYNTEGYARIGTEKAFLFRKGMIYCSRLLLPIIIIMACLKAISYIQENGLMFWKEFSIKRTVDFYRDNFSITDGFVILYAVINVFSYIFTGYADEAMWGTAGWYMGVLPQLMVVFSYFIISRLWIKKDWVVLTLLPVSGFVFLLGYLNRFGLCRIDRNVNLPTFISTIGNINWYCGYLMCTFFFGLYLFWQNQWKKPWQKALLAGYVAIGFASLTTQGSNSGIFATAAVFLVLFWLSAADAQRMKSFWEIVVIFFGISAITFLLRITGVFESTFEDGVMDIFTYTVLPCVMTVVSLLFLLGVRWFMQKGTYPIKGVKLFVSVVCGGAILLIALYVILLVINTVGNGVISKITGLPLDEVLTFTPYWGSLRGASWMAGAMCFWEQNFLHKLVGVGPDCMSAFLYQQGSEEVKMLVHSCFGEQRLTNAHNEWLTILVNNGILGAVGYIGLIVSAIKRCLQSRISNHIAAACGLCVLAYTFNNVFSFQQSMGLSTIFVILGIAENYLRAEKSVKLLNSSKAD